MIQRVRVMLYVNDIDLIRDFWVQYFDAKLLETLDLPEGFQSHTLTLLNEFEFALFPIPFIEKYSPEVLGNTPSIMLFSDNFDELHQQIPNSGDIFDNNGTLTFNFPDPEGNYFVVAPIK